MEHKPSTTAVNDRRKRKTRVRRMPHWLLPTLFECCLRDGTAIAAREVPSPNPTSHGSLFDLMGKLLSLAVTPNFDPWSFLLLLFGGLLVFTWAVFLLKKTTDSKASKKRARAQRTRTRHKRSHATGASSKKPRAPRSGTKRTNNLEHESTAKKTQPRRKPRDSDRQEQSSSEKNPAPPKKART